jgi:predicted MFS family arabinose efflux permease
MAPKFLEDVRGLSVGQIGALGSVGTLGIMVLTLLLGRQPPERRAPLLLAQGAALLALLLWLNASALAWIGLAYFVHGGNRVIRPITTGRLAATLDAATMSFGFGFYQTAQQLGLTLSPYVAGLLYARGPAWPLWAGVAGLLVMMLLTWRMSDGLSRTEKGVDPEARPHRTADG